MGRSKNALGEDTQRTTAAQMIAKNHDLLAQILLGLPANSIDELKLTSKLWLSICRDPSFIRSHILHRPLLLSGLFLQYFTRPLGLSYEYVTLKTSSKADSNLPFVAVQKSTGLTILQSCNGLLLCSDDSSYYICNPTTMCRRRIPPPEGLRDGGDIALNLVFEPQKSLHYKIICMKRLHRQQSLYQIQVYSSETGLWKHTGSTFAEPDLVDFNYGVFCNGAMHWIKNTTSVLYYNVDTQCPKSTPEPPRQQQFSTDRHEYFGQCNGHLYLVVNSPLPNMTLFQMKEDYSGWFIKYIVNLDVLAAKFPSMGEKSLPFTPNFECNVVCISEDAKHDVELVVYVPGELVFLNARTNCSRKVADLKLHSQHSSIWYKHFLMLEHIETLCPV